MSNLDERLRRLELDREAEMVGCVMLPVVLVIIVAAIVLFVWWHG